MNTDDIYESNRTFSDAINKNSSRKTNLDECQMQKKNIYDGVEEYIHEHLFKEVYYPFSTDHKCERSLNRCNTCDAIFCNHCGKRLSPTQSFITTLHMAFGTIHL